MCSLASANGPSVIAGTPSRTLTVLVLEGSASASPPTSSPDSVSSWIAVGEERLGREGRLLEAGALGRLLAADHHRGQLGALLVRVEHLGIDVGDVQLLARLLDVLVEVGDQVLLDRLLGRLQVGPQRLLVSGQLGAAHRLDGLLLPA